MVNKSESMSFEGYNIKTWLTRNKETLKNLLVGVSALATYFSTINEKAWLQIVLTVIIPGLVKLGLDALDFYCTEVKV